MSGKLVNATGVLCRLLEQSKPTINGAALLGGEFGEGGHELVRERLLVLGPALSYVTCPIRADPMARNRNSPNTRSGSGRNRPR